jgi:galactonate dehydratase
MSAIDIALYDLVGKKLGVPVYDLLGGRQREWIPTFATAHSASVEEAVEQATHLADRGWKCIRLGIVEGDESDVFEPREAIAVSAEACIRVREALGNSIVLGIDFHHRLSVAEAASFCQMMPPHTLDFLEEPIRDECPDAYAQLRRLTSTPFAIGEEFASKWAFVPYVERGLTEFARVDVCNVGGLTESMKVAGWCEAHYIDLMPHNPLGPICSAATAHLAAAVANFSWLEIRESPTEPGGDFYPPDVFPVQPELTDGRLTLLDLPGLGVEVNEEALGEPFRPSEMPHLRRPDGSVTNW